MRFVFSAPFRTNINLSSIEAVDASELIANIIKIAIRNTKSNLGKGFSWKTPWVKTCNGELHYSELAEDYLPLSATPLLQLVISDNEMLSDLASSVKIMSVEEVLFKSCTVDYYDNTVGILNVDIVFNVNKYDQHFFSLIDKWSTKYCSLIIKIIKSFEIDMLSSLLVAGRKNESNSFINPGDFYVFFDRNNLEPKSLAKIEEMLWVTRILIKDSGSQCCEILNNWTQQSSLSQRKKNIGNVDVAFCIGNSVIFGSLSNLEESALKASLSISTYFYVIYSIMNKNLRSIYLDLSKGQKVKISLISKASRIRTHIEFIENEFSDVLMGLQGLRSEISRLLLSTWNYSELVKAVQSKKNSVAKVVDSKLQEKQSRYARIIEAILAAIGGVAVLDFSLNLFSFSNNNKIDSNAIPGLVYSTKFFSVDAAIYCILLFLFIVFFSVIKKR